MDHATQPVAVFGATGAQGGPVATALLDAGRPVRAIARTEEKLGDLKARGADVVALDLADAGAVEWALEGVGGAFVHLPFMPVMELMEAWAGSVGKALVGAGVPLAVFSSSGPVPTEDVGMVTFDTKAAADRTLRASGAPIVFLEPTVYLGNTSAPFSAPSVFRDGEMRYPPVPSEHRLAWISAEDQASLAIAALGRPDLVGRTFRIGERLTGPELAGASAPGSAARCATRRWTPKSSAPAWCRCWASRQDRYWPPTTPCSPPGRMRCASTPTPGRYTASSASR
jgi:uncharacterized protein YbjT (DUF2867 family)